MKRQRFQRPNEYSVNNAQPEILLHIHVHGPISGRNSRLYLQTIWITVCWFLKAHRQTGSCQDCPECHGLYGTKRRYKGPVTWCIYACFLIYKCGNVQTSQLSPIGHTCMWRMNLRLGFPMQMIYSDHLYNTSNTPLSCMLFLAGSDAGRCVWILTCLGVYPWFSWKLHSVCGHAESLELHQ